MEVTCPSCGAVFGMDKSMGADQVCPACMFPFRWEGDTAQGLPAGMQLEVQGEDGQLLGRMSRIGIREQIYAGELSGVERVRLDGGEWEPIGSRPEFTQVLALVGVDVAGLAVARQQIKGWKRDASAGGDKPRPRPQVLPRTDRAPTVIDVPGGGITLDSRMKAMLGLLAALVLFWLVDFFSKSF